MRCYVLHWIFFLHSIFLYSTHTYLLKWVWKEKKSTNIQFEDKEISRLNHSNQWNNVFMWCLSRIFFFYVFRFDSRPLRRIALFSLSLIYGHSTSVKKHEDKGHDCPLGKTLLPLKWCLFRQFLLSLIKNRKRSSDIYHSFIVVSCNVLVGFETHMTSIPKIYQHHHFIAPINVSCSRN